MRIVSIVGARPQFIKAAIVSRRLRSVASISETLVHTGQHSDAEMSDVFFSQLGIPRPDRNLGISGGSRGEMTGRMLDELDDFLSEERPDMVVVYGDTNSTLAGALAAVKLQIPAAHVEAGLRSFNRRMPEEINRILTDHASEILMAPTETAVVNLRNEGVPERKITLTGDVMYDAALDFRERAAETSNILASLSVLPREYILATVHRAENTDEGQRLRAVCEGLMEVSRKYPVVLPLHPRTRAIMERDPHLAELGASLCMTSPVGYLDMVQLERNALVIATDSGGVQKEAFFHRVPCVTLRDETEWVELVELGWSRLAPPRDSGSVSSAILSAIGTSGSEADPYGGGKASERVVRAILDA